MLGGRGGGRGRTVWGEAAGMVGGLEGARWEGDSVQLNWGLCRCKNSGNGLQWRRQVKLWLQAQFVGRELVACSDCV